MSEKCLTARLSLIARKGIVCLLIVSPQSLNLYTYCGNDPINYTDPSGMFFGSLFRWIWRIIRAIVAVVLAVIAVIAFSMQQHWAGVALLMTSASIIAGLFNLKTLQKLIGVASIALSIVRIRMGVGSTPPIFGLLGGGGGDRGGIDIGTLSIFANIGAIANSLDKKKKRRNLTPAEILAKTIPLVEAALQRPECRNYIAENKQSSLLSNDPRQTLQRMIKGRNDHRLINEGKYHPNKPQTAAQAGIDNELDPTNNTLRQYPTIRLWKPFFADGFSPNLLATVQGKFKMKAIALLHELKHVYSGDAPPSHDQPGGWNDDIASRCF